MGLIATGFIHEPDGIVLLRSSTGGASRKKQNKNQDKNWDMAELPAKYKYKINKDMKLNHH